MDQFVKHYTKDYWYVKKTLYKILTARFTISNYDLYFFYRKRHIFFGMALNQKSLLLESSLAVFIDNRSVANHWKIISEINAFSFKYRQFCRLPDKRQG